MHDGKWINKEIVSNIYIYIYIYIYMFIACASLRLKIKRKDSEEVEKRGMKGSIVVCICIEWERQKKIEKMCVNKK